MRLLVVGLMTVSLMVLFASALAQPCQATTLTGEVVNSAQDRTIATAASCDLALDIPASLNISSSSISEHEARYMVIQRAPLASLWEIIIPLVEAKGWKLQQPSRKASSVDRIYFCPSSGKSIRISLRQLGRSFRFELLITTEQKHQGN